ncbi:UNVERIFIED_CONTAM: hypothetical protein GTU68_001790, partial [Idotea baltica]|nr:hypothetical protein [Idotea baltica]
LSAVLLGILEGVTEFIPVSSTGHLILFSNLIDFTGEKEKTFSIFIQLGAILAVVFLYCAKNFNGLDGILKLLVAFLPAAIMGLLFYKYIKTKLFYPLPVSIALIIGGIIMIIIKDKSKNSTSSLDNVTYKQALVIGLFQCFSLCPGVSRSGSTIIGGMLSGLNKKTAADFSFILAVPIMLAAVSFDLLKSIDILSFSDIPIFLVGFIASFISAYFAIKFFIKILVKFSLKPFGYYRIVIGLICIFILVLK